MALVVGIPDLLPRQLSKNSEHAIIIAGRQNTIKRYRNDINVAGVIRWFKFQKMKNNVVVRFPTFMQL